MKIREAVVEKQIQWVLSYRRIGKCMEEEYTGRFGRRNTGI